MDEYQIKIYIANENDTLDTISEKFNIDKKLIIIFNPLLKNKYKLSNLPIKIPYKKEESRVITEVTEEKKEDDNFSINEFAMKVIKPFKSYILYKGLRNYESEFQKKKIYQVINIVNKEEDREIYTEFISNIIEIIDNYDNFTNEEFEQAIDKLNSCCEKLSNDTLKKLFTILLTYNNKIKNKEYEEAELLLDSYESNI